MALTLPNLGLKVWNAPTDPYNSAQLATNWIRVDEHDHSPGRGRPLGPNSLADYAVTEFKLADLSVTTAKLADGAVTAAKVAADAIATINLAAGAVTSPEWKPSHDVASATALTWGLTGTADMLTSTFTLTEAVKALFVARIGWWVNVGGPVAAGTRQYLDAALKLNVDGAAQTFQPVFGYDSTDGQYRWTYGNVFGCYVVPLSAGSHTVKIQATTLNRVLGSGGTVSAGGDSQLLRVDMAA